MLIADLGPSAVLGTVVATAREMHPTGLGPPGNPHDVDLTRQEVVHTSRGVTGADRIHRAFTQPLRPLRP